LFIAYFCNLCVYDQIDVTLAKTMYGLLLTSSATFFNASQKRLYFTFRKSCHMHACTHTHVVLHDWELWKSLPTLRASTVGRV